MGCPGWLPGIVASFLLISFAVGFYRHRATVSKQELIQKEESLANARTCINKDSPRTAKLVLKACEQVDIDLLPEEYKPAFSRAFSALKAQENKRVLALPKRERAALHAAQLRAEGWRQPVGGIFMISCDKFDCPGPKGDWYYRTTYRVMVWCKERPCGDIYAQAKIEQDGVAVDWPETTAYGERGQRVLLRFYSEDEGTGTVVKFSAYR